MKNCKGTYLFVNGDKYEGEWKNGKANGQGTKTWASGGKYKGEWKFAKQHGQGTETWPEGDKYVGEYQYGKFHGQGTYTWPSGNKYVGEFKNDKHHGQGTYTSADGLKHVGEYRNNTRHGQGRYVIDGKTYAGVFVDGGLTGKVGLKFYSREKNTSNSQWRIGNIYAGGLGVPKDLHKAIEYYTKAAGKGHAKSKAALDSMRREHERTAIEACMFENIKKLPMIKRNVLLRNTAKIK